MVREESSPVDLAMLQELCNVSLATGAGLDNLAFAQRAPCICPAVFDVSLALQSQGHISRSPISASIRLHFYLGANQAFFLILGISWDGRGANYTWNLPSRQGLQKW